MPATPPRSTSRLSRSRDPALTHALKEVDGAALAVAETPEQVVELLRYAMTGALHSAA